MPVQPNNRQVHVDAVLTNISVAYIQSANDFIATRVFPVVRVSKQSDRYFIYTKNDWFRDEAQKRGPGTESAGGGYTLDNTPTYFCDVWAWHHDVPDQIRANADAPLNPDSDATKFVTQRLLLRQENQWVSDYFKTGVWATDVSGVTTTPSAGQFYKWSDYVNSDPILDVEAGKQQVLGTTGFMPNKLTLSYVAFRYLKHHPDIVDRMKYTGRDVADEAMLAQLFGLDEVLVARAVKATNKEGETASYSFAHGSHALLTYSAPAAGLMTPSAGYTFSWDGVSGGLGEAVGISRFRMDPKRSDRIEGEVAFANKVVAADMGYFFSNAA